jgi:hypothetical protein
MVKLYKMVDGQIRLVDFGVMDCVELYRAQGFIVRPAGEKDHEPIWVPAVVEEPKRVITVCRRPKRTSFWTKVRNFVSSIIPMEVCYA